MLPVIVLKFGSSVLACSDDLPTAVDEVYRRLREGARVLAVISAFAGDTDIFITPGYRFKAIDVLLTNFHLPRSTLFMLVSAFGGLERMRAAYGHAIAAGYRFYSYGDACLIEPREASPR